MLWDSGRKPENLEEIQTDTGRICKSSNSTLGLGDWSWSDGLVFHLKLPDLPSVTLKGIGSTATMTGTNLLLVMKIRFYLSNLQIPGKIEILCNGGAPKSFVRILSFWYAHQSIYVKWGNSVMKLGKEVCCLHFRLKSTWMIYQGC